MARSVTEFWVRARISNGYGFLALAAVLAVLFKGCGVLLPIAGAEIGLVQIRGRRDNAISHRHEQPWRPDNGRRCDSCEGEEGLAP